MPVYRPSFVAKFQLLFDEALIGKPPDKPENVEDRVSKPVPQYTPVAAEKPAITSPGKDKKASFVFGRIPKAASVELPGYRQAATFSLTLDYLDLPIDPRVVRGCAVELHLGTVAASDYAEGAKGTPKSGQYVTVLDTHNPDGSTNTETLLMLGIVDDWEVKHSGSGSVVEIKGRDPRGVLIDTSIEIAPGHTNQLLDKIDYAQSIDKVVAQILAVHPLFARFNVVVNAADWANGIVPTVSGDSELRHRMPAKPLLTKKGTPRKTLSANAGATSFWDLIVKFCYLVGAIPYFVGYELHIRPSRTIYDQMRGDVDPVKNPTPFRGKVERTRDNASGAPIDPGLRWRRFVYGRDIESLSFTRKFAGHSRPKIIRVVGALDPVATKNKGQLQYFEGMWPPPVVGDPKITKANPGKNSGMEEILNVKAPAIADHDALVEIARATYEELGRGEMGGSVETTNLASFAGGNPDPDCLRLKPGDGVEFLVNAKAFNATNLLISTLNSLEQAAFENAVAAIAIRLGDLDLARAIVTTARGGNSAVQRFFRVQTVKYSWSTSGVKVSFDFQNYFVTRSQTENASATPGTASTISTPAQTNAPSGKLGTAAKNPSFPNKDDARSRQ